MAVKSAEMIRLLLNSGADPNLQDEKGETALMKSRKPEFINLLFQAGADPTIKNNNGQTVLHRWLSLLDGPMIDDLISRGCQIDEPDKNGFTPLISAADAPYRKVALALLEKGADPNSRDPKGRSALHVFLLDIEKHPWRYDGERDPPFAAALLEAGIQPADKDDEGDSALITVNRLARKDSNTIPLKDMVLQYTDAEDAKAAKKTAVKMVAAKKRKDFGKALAEDIPSALKALSVPAVWGGLSVLMRESAFKDNPSANIMGPVNGAITLGGSGMVLGFLWGAAVSKGGWEGLATGLLGAFVGTAAGAIVAMLPPVKRAFTDNPVLYYSPLALIGLAVILNF
jgi:hypothetical protein